MAPQTMVDRILFDAVSSGINFSLPSIIRSANYLEEVRKSRLNAGDVIFVKTVKSLYCIRSLGEGVYEASGGWFDKEGLSSVPVRISGCTWGGSAIKIDLIAACGLRIEFGNRLVTSPVQKFFVLHRYGLN